jgi:hypothetical protein
MQLDGVKHQMQSLSPLRESMLRNLLALIIIVRSSDSAAATNCLLAVLVAVSTCFGLDFGDTFLPYSKQCQTLLLPSDILLFYASIFFLLVLHQEPQRYGT